MRLLLLVLVLVGCGKDPIIKEVPAPKEPLFKLWKNTDKNILLDLSDSDFGQSTITWIYKSYPTNFYAECKSEFQIGGDNVSGSFRISRSTFISCSGNWDPGCYQRNMTGTYRIENEKLYLCSDGGLCERYEQP